MGQQPPPHDERNRPPPYYEPHHHIDVDYERQRAAATRDYTTPAVVTLILYFVCWIPGIVANVIYFLQAQKDEALIGRSPEGKGCLIWLLVVMNGVWILGALLYCAFFFMSFAFV